MAAVCCDGDEAAALDLVDQLASKSLVVAEPAAGGTRYRMLETIRQYAAGCLAEAGEAGPARRRHAEAFLRLAEEERELPVLLREQGNFRAALGHTLTGGSQIGPRLARALASRMLLVAVRDRPGGSTPDQRGLWHRPFRKPMTLLRYRGIAVRLG
jgi:predicted ATPase